MINTLLLILIVHLKFFKYQRKLYFPWGREGRRRESERKVDLGSERGQERALPLRDTCIRTKELSDERGHTAVFVESFSFRTLKVILSETEIGHQRWRVQYVLRDIERMHTAINSIWSCNILKTVAWRSTLEWTPKIVINTTHLPCRIVSLQKSQRLNVVSQKASRKLLSVIPVHDWNNAIPN